MKMDKCKLRTTQEMTTGRENYRVSLREWKKNSGFLRIYKKRFRFVRGIMKNRTDVLMTDKERKTCWRRKEKKKSWEGIEKKYILCVYEGKESKCERCIKGQCQTGMPEVRMRRNERYICEESDRKKTGSQEGRTRWLPLCPKNLFVSISDQFRFTASSNLSD